MNYAELSMAISDWLNRDQIDKSSHDFGSASAIRGQPDPADGTT
jgi:hypothetical protein